MAGACKKPDQKAFSELLTPLQASIEKVVRLKESNRKDRDWFNHLSAVASGAPAVGWITIVSRYCCTNDFLNEPWIRNQNPVLMSKK